MTRIGPDQPNADQPGYIERLVGQHYAQPEARLRFPARDDLADELDDLADRLPFGSPTVSRAVLDEDRRNLHNAAEALRASAPSEARVGGWEVRSEGMHGEPPHAIERGTGPDLEVFVTGIESYDDACKIEAALNEPASPDPAPDRVAEGAFARAVAAEIARARAKFPGNRHQYVALAEEVGEIAKALIEGESPEAIYAECVQVAAMAQRVAEDGDDDFPGYEPAPSDRVAEGTLCPTCKSDDPRYYCIPFIGKRHQGDPLVCDDSFHATAPTGVRDDEARVDPKDVERLRDLVEVGPGSHLNRLDRAALDRVVAAVEPATTALKGEDE